MCNSYRIIIIFFSCLILFSACVGGAAQQKEPANFTPTKIDEKWGYADETGEMVIPAQFADARPFADGLAAVAVAQTSKAEDVIVLQLLGKYLKWGFIDLSGKFVIPPRFAEVGDFSEGYSKVSIDPRELLANAKWGFIDKLGVMKIRPRYYSAEGFSNGRARVSIGNLRSVGFKGSTNLVKFFGKHGYIDKLGKFTKTSEAERFAHSGDN